jgi:hypothetical protein
MDQCVVLRLYPEEMCPADQPSIPVHSLEVQVVNAIPHHFPELINDFLSLACLACDLLEEEPEADLSQTTRRINSSGSLT